MLTSLSGQFQVPGLSSQYDTITKDILWGRDDWTWLTTALVSGASRDGGNSPTTLLRPGLLLGIITATKKWIQWDPTATDGSENIAGVLLADISAQILGANADRFMGLIAIRGGVKAASLIRGGNASYGIASDAYEAVIRKQMAKNFIFDDKPQYAAYGWARTKVITATTLAPTAADQDTLFIMNQSAECTVTLPTMLEGMRFGFYNLANQNLIVASTPADTLVTLNDAAADSIALSTANEKIGGMFEVLGISTGQALVVPHLWEAQTVTVVTA